MGIEKFNDLLNLSKGVRKKSSGFDVRLSKLATSLVFNPDCGLTFLFGNYNGQQSFIVYDKSPNHYNNFSSVIVPLGGNIVSKTMSLMKAENAVYNYFRQNELLNHETMLEKGNHLLWSSLDNIANAKSHHINGFQNSAFQNIVKSIDDLKFQLNTYRKLYKFTDGNDADIESAMTSVITTLNYFKGDKQNMYQKTSVNDKTFFSCLDDLKSMNKLIRAITSTRPGCMNDTDYLCCISSYDNHLSDDMAAALEPFYCEGFCSNLVDTDFKVSQNDLGYKISSKILGINVPIDTDVYSIDKVKSSKSITDDEKQKLADFILSTFAIEKTDFDFVESLNKNKYSPSTQVDINDEGYRILLKNLSFEKRPEQFDENLDNPSA